MSEDDQLSLDIGEPAVTARAAPRKGRARSSSPEQPAPTELGKGASPAAGLKAAGRKPRERGAEGASKVEGRGLPPSPSIERSKRATKDKDERAAGSVPRQAAPGGVAGADRDTSADAGGASGADRRQEAREPDPPDAQLVAAPPEGVSVRDLLCMTCYRYTQVIEPQGPFTDPRTYKCGSCLEGRE